MLHKSYRGQYIYEGYFIHQKKLEEALKKAQSESTQDNSGTQNDEEDAEELDDQGCDLVYIKESNKDFDCYAYATIVIEHEFYLKKFE